MIIDRVINVVPLTGIDKGGEVVLKVITTLKNHDSISSIHQFHKG